MTIIHPKIVRNSELSSSIWLEIIATISEIILPYIYVIMETKITFL